jgi:Family of unknown function (DUF6627)
MKSRIRRFLAGLLVVCMGSVAVPVPALAGIVSTDAIVSGAQRERLVVLLERSDVQARLKALGVDAAAAKARVAALSDAQAAQLAAQLDELPAGGTDLLVVGLIVFLVLLFTDVMGYTKVFPFTRSVR